MVTDGVPVTPLNAVTVYKAEPFTEHRKTTALACEPSCLPTSVETPGTNNIATSITPNLFIKISFLLKMLDQAALKEGGLRATVLPFTCSILFKVSFPD
jgi:hypothetical protein